MHWSPARPATAPSQRPPETDAIQDAAFRCVVDTYLNRRMVTSSGGQDRREGHNRPAGRRRAARTVRRDYRVTAHGSGAAGPGREATTFHVHGGGLIIGRIVNELGIARPVTAAVKQTFGPGHAA